jgi:hypothetical protein
MAKNVKIRKQIADFGFFVPLGEEKEKLRGLFKDFLLGLFIMNRR